MGKKIINIVHMDGNVPICHTLIFRYTHFFYTFYAICLQNETGTLQGIKKKICIKKKLQHLHDLQ